MMRMRTLIAVLCAAGALSAALPGLALAAESPVITDCNSHGSLTRSYSASELRIALNTLPPTVKEYTNCYDLINRALLAQVGSGGGGSTGKSSGGSFLPVWLIVLLVAVIVAGGGYALVASRRQGPPEGGGGAPSAGGGAASAG